MSKDYKDSGRGGAKTKAKPKSGTKNCRTSVEQKKSSMGCMIFWIVLVIIVGGLFVYLLIFLSGDKFSGSTVAGDVKANVPDNKLSHVEKISRKQIIKKTKEQDKTEQVVKTDVEKPRFEFYTILPDMEVVIPEEELQLESNNKPHNGVVDKAIPVEIDVSKYVLQVGSFIAHKDADRLKAKLALLGVQAHIQAVEISRGDRRYRVRIGDFSGISNLKKTKKLLTDNRMESILIKMKPKSR